MFHKFWNTVIGAVEEVTREPVSNDELFRKLYFMNGILQCGSNMLKVFMQEFYPNFTPEIQEGIDKQLNIFMREMSGKFMKGIERERK